MVTLFVTLDFKMEIYVKLILIFIFAAISGCAAVTSSGIQRIGEDTYTVSAQMSAMVLGGTENSGLTRAKAISEANAYCVSQDSKYAEVTEENITRGESATVIINFKCPK